MCEEKGKSNVSHVGWKMTINGIEGGSHLTVLRLFSFSMCLEAKNENGKATRAILGECCMTCVEDENCRVRENLCMAIEPK